MSNPTELPDLDRIANDLESEAMPYEGDFADAVRAAIEDIREVAAARRAQPEDEAPLRKCSKFGHRCNCAVDCDPAKPHTSIAATLSPLCGAQHAESGKESGCRMTGGICACRSGGAFGGCARERSSCCTNEPARAAQFDGGQEGSAT